MTILEVDRTQPADWHPTRETLAQLRTVVNREAYPPAQRSGAAAATGRAR